MTRDVIVTICGIQTYHEEGESTEPIVETYPGTYYKKGDKHYITYETQNEDEKAKSRHMLKLQENALELIRNGSGGTHMVIEDQKKYVMSYQTPVGSLFIGIDGKAVHLEESEHCIYATASYALEQDGEKIADCRLQIEVRSTE